MKSDLESVPERRKLRRTKLWMALALICFLLALLLLPPFVSISRYKARITELMSESLGRPVRLSSVELRMLPRPGFVITDLVVEEDPAFGAEPVLHADTVAAAIRLFPLWRGRLEISRVSVDDASFNLVKASAGHWNLDSLFRTAATKPGSIEGRAVPLPYIEATNSRVNVKDGAEKRPYSLLNSDLTFWQEDSGEWRLRLRGQPARTDVTLQLPDTGVVRLEASIRGAQIAGQMPIHLDLDWREAQLGQLTRLLTGTDPGWRGDLTGELHLDGTAQTAKVTSRLRATGVHRAEFAPATPLDFDATCHLIYHYARQTAENLVCDSPIGDGRARLTGALPDPSGNPDLTLELDRAPLQLALDALRTVRSGLDPSLQVSGSVSGKMTYDPVPAAPVSPTVRPTRKHPAKLPPSPPPALTGSFTFAGVELSGGGLDKPLQIAKASLDPAPAQPDKSAALIAIFPIPAGGASPLNLNARLDMHGYHMSVQGSASLPRLQELAHLAAISDLAPLQEVAGQPATLDLTAEGEWIPTSTPIIDASTPPATPPSPPDRFSGTVTLHDSSWKAAFLANPIEISTGVLHLGDRNLRWDPVDFTYGPVEGTATLTIPTACEPAQKCPPQFTVSFDSLDANTLQAAILGAHEPGTLLSTLIDRFKPASTPTFPEMEGTVHADSFALAPVTLTDTTAAIKLQPQGVEITSLDGTIFSGQLLASGSITFAEKPSYKLKGQFHKIDSAAVSKLFSLRGQGRIDGNGQVELSGFTDADLAASAKGSVHFDWDHGSLVGDSDTPAPPTLARFDRWTADGEVEGGGVTLNHTNIVRNTKNAPLNASVTFANPPKVDFFLPASPTSDAPIKQSP